MTIGIKGWFTNGLPWHTMEWLEDNYDTLLAAMQGRTWLWTGYGLEVLPPPWTRIEYTEFDPPFIYQSWFYWR